MSPTVVGLLLAVYAFVLVIAAFAWVRFVVSVLAWVVRQFAGHGAPSPDRQPKAGPAPGRNPKGAKRPPKGVVDRGGVGYPARHYFTAGTPVVFLFGVAMEPDFESFFGGFTTAVAAGGVLLIAVVVVMAIRRFTSF